MVRSSHLSLERMTSGSLALFVMMIHIKMISGMDQDVRQMPLKIWTTNRFLRNTSSTFGMLWRELIEKLRRRERHSSTRFQRRDVISLSRTSQWLGMKVTSDNCSRSMGISRTSDLKKDNKAISLLLFATSPQIVLQMPNKVSTDLCMKANLFSSTSTRSKKLDRFISRKQLTSLTLRSTKLSMEEVQVALELMTWLIIPIWLIFSSNSLRSCTKMIWLDQVMDTMTIETTIGITDETIRTIDRITETTMLMEVCIKIVEVTTSSHSNQGCQEPVATHQTTLLVWLLRCQQLLQVVHLCNKLLLKWLQQQDT